jgi:hypothetical protein
MFCAPGLVFGGTGGVKSRFLLLRSPNLFRRYRGCRVPFSCFARPYTFSAIPRASGPVFMFCASELVFGGTKGVWSRFHILLIHNHFWRCQVRRVPFSCFALPDSFSAVPGVSGPVFLFCSPGLISVVPRASGPVFMFCTPGHVFSGTDGVGPRLLILRARTSFRRYGGRPVLFLCFALPDSFSALPRAYGPVFMICAHRQVFGGAKGVESRFHVLRCRTRFRWHRGRPVPCSCFPLPDIF